MSAALYALYALGHLALAAWGFRLWLQSRRRGLVFLLLVSLGLVYDNLILAAGSRIGIGPTLHTLSVLRFAVHQLILPWIIISAFDQARQAGLRWAQSPRAEVFAWGFAALVMLLGVLTRLVGLELVPVELNGVTRYLVEDPFGPPLVSILSIGFVGVVSFLLWRRAGWPWLFPVVLVVFIAEGTPIEGLRLVVGSGLEVVFMAAMYATQAWLK